MRPGAWREIWRSETDGLRRAYRRQVALLIRTLPFVAAGDCFVMKGGTAINLFVGDLPRLSVDIDLTYLLILMRESPFNTYERESLPGNDLDGMSPVLHEQTGSLDPQLFDRLRWRDARFRAKGAAELPWA
jgi:hypothetical protein